jgi:hypothetical protein
MHRSWKSEGAGGGGIGFWSNFYGGYLRLSENLRGPFYSIFMTNVFKPNPFPLPVCIYGYDLLPYFKTNSESRLMFSRFMLPFGLSYYSVYIIELIKVLYCIDLVNSVILIMRLIVISEDLSRKEIKVSPCMYSQTCANGYL